MSLLFDEIICELQKAADRAEYTNAVFANPGAEIQVLTRSTRPEVHGNVGDVFHPDEYIKRMTKLYRDSWVVAPIKRVIELIRSHEAVFKDAEKLSELLQDTGDLVKSLENLLERHKYS